MNEGSNGIRAMETHQSNGKLPGGIGAATASDELGHASPSERDQIEEEMKTMIERMREYKAKNPTLFSQIWEQVKKVCLFYVFCAALMGLALAPVSTPYWGES